MKSAMLKADISGMKKLISRGKFIFTKRQSNLNFLKEIGYTVSDVKDILLSISPDDCHSGPESDFRGDLGRVYVFMVDIEIDDRVPKVYVKIRINPPDEVVCISFHEEGQHN